MHTLLLCLVLSSSAFADEADKAACEGLVEGDDCTRGDGDPGTCQLDADDDVLSCDDDTPADDAGGADDSAGCTTVGLSPSLALLVCAAAGIRRRARR